MYCPNHRLMRPGHTCNGYRLPNQFEWQYLARAGTTTGFYTGNMRNPNTLECVVEPALEGQRSVARARLVTPIASEPGSPWA